MSTRKRLSPQESRLAALQAARQLLIESGPQSVTLKAVAARIGRTHANLLHHFGSASDLQKALAAFLAQTVCESVAGAFRAVGNGESTPREVVDLVFDAFGANGGGALVMWMLATGHEDALDPVMEAIRNLVDALAEEYQGEGGDPRAMYETTLPVVLLALGDGLLGETLARSLGVTDERPRDLAEWLIGDAIARQMGTVPAA